MSFGEKILRYQEDILRDLAELIRIPSVRSQAEPGMPFGRESTRALQAVLAMAERLGLTVKNVDNYAGHAEYGQGEETAAVLAHVDVVPAGEGWETDPFTMVIKDGCCYGRGTADDKGEAIVALYCLKALKDENVPARRRLRVVFGAGEETGSEDLAYYYSKEPLPVMGFTPDAEYGICNREKGILRVDICAGGNDSSVVRSLKAGTVVNAVPAKAEAELACTPGQFAALQKAAETAEGSFAFEERPEGGVVRSTGVASHAMQPQEGVNAASRLMKLLACVFSEEQLGSLIAFANRAIGLEYDGASLGVKTEDGESGPLTLNLGLVSLGAGEASLSLDIRYPVTKDGERILAQIKGEAEKAGLALAASHDTKPLYLPAESPFISLLKDAYQAVMGVPAQLYATGGGTYARSLKSRGVAFGPFFDDEPDRRLHNTGEHFEIARFMQHAQICLEAMYRMITAE